MTNMNDQSNPGTDPRLYDPSKNLTDQVAAEKAKLQENGASLEAAAAGISDIKAEAIVAQVKSGKRVFVSPSKQNSTIMVRPGTVQIVYAGTNRPVVQGAPATNGTEAKRLGDIKAKFVGGILVVDPSVPDGQTILDWAESHPEICRDAMDPQSDIWVAMKQSQLNLAAREPSLPGNINVDKVLAGDYSGFNERDSVASRARRMLQTEDNKAEELAAARK